MKNSVSNRHFLNSLKKLPALLCCNKGGAVIEFVALALPLFIPLFLFINQYALVSDTESALRTLGREMSRAIVTSESDEVAFSVAEEVFVKGARILGLSEEVANGSVRYEVECAVQPCISPNNEVQVRITSDKLGRTIAAVEYVSPWA